MSTVRLAISLLAFGVATALAPVGAPSGYESINSAVTYTTIPVVASEPRAPDDEQIKATLAGMPLSFVENKGQADAEVSYYLQGSQTSVWFTPTGLTMARPDSPAADDVSSKTAGAGGSVPDDDGEQRWGLTLDFVGAKVTAPVGEHPAPGVVSYFTGPTQEWVTGLPTYHRLVYRDLWPGIDLAYSGTADRLKYEFVVAPGADPSQITLTWRGAVDVTLDDSGALRVTCGAGSFTDTAPVSYQKTPDGGRADVSSGFDLGSTGDSVTYGFTLGGYDPTRPLIINPASLVYAGYLGGTSFEGGVDIAVDSSGAAYISSSGPGYP